MIKRIKELFKREQHIHYHNNACSAVQWRDMVVVARPDGRVYLLKHDVVSGTEIVQEIRLGY